MPIMWKDGNAPSEVLRQVRVFDRKEAALYVEEKTGDRLLFPLTSICWIALVAAAFCTEGNARFRN